MKKLFYFSLVAMLAANLVGCVKDEKNTSHLLPGESIPSFTTFTIDSKNVSNESLQGKPAVIVFFDSWCPDCKEELPEIERFFQIAGEYVNVLAVSRSQNKNEVATYWSDCGFEMPVCAPGTSALFDLFDRGSRSGIPQVYVLDEHGIVKAFYLSDNPVTLPELSRITGLSELLKLAYL